MKPAILFSMMMGGMLSVVNLAAQTKPLPAAKQAAASSEPADRILGRKIQQESLSRTSIDTLPAVRSYVHYTPRKRTKRGE